ncbi:hypothetical protein JTE90_026622 [Oedothorax gibbosus]|uniref:Uncharacterized protein n=1 Tax=Oedothorax gibbosus TaxID=931172 RepID=A0AAV6TJW6_9ARAC|nr:hypothetical protein JTE90_026622 [Oedothorax gibbosus]
MSVFASDALDRAFVHPHASLLTKKCPLGTSSCLVRPSVMAWRTSHPSKFENSLRSVRAAPRPRIILLYH